MPQLQVLLRNMAAAGKKSFEELLARIVGSVIGGEMLLAKSGTQYGDGSSANGRIVIQAKRYREETSLDLNSIEGEVREIAAQNPALEVFVLGATKSVQERQRFRRIEGQTGVTIVVIDWGGDEAPLLGALCIIHWDVISGIEPFTTLAHSWSDWIRTMQADETLQRVASRLASEVAEHVQSYRHVAANAAKILHKRIEDAHGTATADRSNLINLAASVSRRQIEEGLDEWWNSTKLIAILQGEEGMGKTWAAARFSYSLQTRTDILIVWLDSDQWGEISSLENLLKRALSQCTKDEALAKVAHKAQRIWNRPILLVLDGVNERDAHSSAIDILRDYKRRLDSIEPPRTPIRILFTTRDAAAQELRREADWLHTIEVHPYTDDELGKAIALAEPNLQLEDLPESLRGVARIPRYLPTCCQLISQVGSFEHITIELVLWCDLLRRIKDDPNFRALFGFGNEVDAQDVLAKLATHSEDGAASERLLNELFDNRYRTIRKELVELRWLTDARLGDARSPINPNHLRLAWALYIRQRLRDERNPDADFESLIQKTLEPLLGEDQRTAALKVCARMLLAEPEALGTDSHRKLQALLTVWIQSRNISGVAQELEFWLERKIDSTVRVIEDHIYRSSNLELRQKAVIPLARQWAKGGNGAEQLISYLERWLLTISAPEQAWKDKDLTAKIDGHSVLISGHRFPWTPTPAFLKMAGVALSVISTRPETSLLRVLALAVATEKYNLVDRGTPRIGPDGPQPGIVWLPSKDVWNSVELLMRWTFTETALADLLHIARSNPTDELLLHGVRWLAAFLWQVNVPSDLHLPPDCGYRHLSRKSVAQKVLGGEVVFAPETDIEEVVKYLEYKDQLAAWAAREDVDWQDTDKEPMISATRATLGKIQESGLFGFAGAIPWIARWKPESAAELLTDVLPEILPGGKVFIPDAVERIFLVPPSRRDEVLALIRERLDAALNEEGMMRMQWAVELLLLLLNEDDWMSWLEWISERPWIRRMMLYYPLPQLSRLLVPPNAILEIHQRLIELPIDDSDRRNASEFAFWAIFPVHSKVPSQPLFEKLKSWLLKNDPKDFWHPYFELLLSVAPLYPDTINAVGNLAQNPQLRRVIQGWLNTDQERCGLVDPDTPYLEAKKILPWDTLGRFLLRHSRLDDLKQWGHDLIAYVKNLMAKSEEIETPPGPIQLRLNNQTGVVSLKNSASEPKETHFTSSSSQWFADDAADGAMRELKLDDPTERQRKFDEWNRWFDKAASLADGQGRLWMYFSAHEELLEWARRFPDDFKAVALPLLAALREWPCEAWSAEKLVNTVRRDITFAWFGLDPGSALKDRRESGGGWDLITDYGLSVMNSISWRPDSLGVVGHEGHRRSLMLNAKNDFEVARMSIAAQEFGSEEALFLLAEEWAASALMKERALAASMLAWVESEEAGDRLELLAASDSSHWVRRHAGWALEVWKCEMGARRLFKEAIAQEEPWRASIKFVQMYPALNFSARWWLQREVVGLLDDASISASVRALAYRTYYRFQSVKKTYEKAGGRTLQEYWRGEKISIRAHYLYPLWDVDCNLD